MTSYPVVRAQPGGALDVFNGNGRLARRGQREVERALITGIVEQAKREFRSETFARMTFSGAERSMELARNLADAANDDPACMAIGGAYLSLHLKADLADLEATARNL